MEMTLAILNNNVNPQIADEIKCLLKEIYNISEGEASFIINNSGEIVESLLVDYTPYVYSIQEISNDIRNTLDEHLKQVNEKEQIVLKMMNEAAVWFAFDRIRQFYKNAI